MAAVIPRNCPRCTVDLATRDFYLDKNSSHAFCRKCTQEIIKVFKASAYYEQYVQGRRYCRALKFRVLRSQDEAARLKSCEYARHSRERNPERYKQNLRLWRIGLKKKMFQHYGYVCSCCGEDDTRFLTLDHKNNDGAAHRKELDGTQILYRLKALGWPPGFQTLCCNCNFGRARNGGICPHEDFIEETG